MSFLSKLGRVALGAFYAVSIVGLPALFRSFKRVKPGEVALLSNNDGTTEILEPGLYYRPFPGDRFGPSQDRNQDYINLGPQKIVTVKEGYLGVSYNKGKLEIIKPGVKRLTHAQHTFDPATGFVDTSQNYYKLGPKTVVKIPTGYLGKSYEYGNLIVLEAGTHTLEHAQHTFDPNTGFVSIDQDVADLGPTKIVTVKNGYVGVSYRKGELEILQPGRYELSLPDYRTWGHTLSVQQEVMDLDKIESMTSNNIPVLVDAVITCTVENAKLAAPKGERLFPDIKDLAKTCMAGIIRRFSFRDINPSFEDDQLTSSVVPAVGEASTSVGGKEGENRRKGKEKENTTREVKAGTSAQQSQASRKEQIQQIHDRFVARLAKLLKPWGVGKIDLQIKNIIPANEKLQRDIAELGERNAMIGAQTKQAQFKAQQMTIQARAEQQKTIIDAEAAKQKVLLEAEASKEAAEINAKKDANVSQVRTQAEIQAQLAKAEAGAKAKQIDSKAKAAAIKRIAEAEGERMQVLGKAAEAITTETGRDLALGQQRIKQIEAAAESGTVVFIPQPEFGQTNVWKHDGNKTTFFRTGQRTGNGASRSQLIDALALAQTSKMTRAPQPRNVSVQG